MTLTSGTIIQIVVTPIAIGISWGTLNNSVKYIQKTLDDDVRPDLKSLFRI